MQVQLQCKKLASTKKISYAYVYSCITVIFITKSPDAFRLSYTYTLMHASIIETNLAVLVLWLMLVFSRFEVGFDEIAYIQAREERDDFLLLWSNRLQVYGKAFFFRIILSS